MISIKDKIQEKKEKEGEELKVLVLLPEMFFNRIELVHQVLNAIKLRKLTVPSSVLLKEMGQTLTRPFAFNCTSWPCTARNPA